MKNKRGTIVEHPGLAKKDHYMNGGRFLHEWEVKDCSYPTKKTKITLTTFEGVDHLYELDFGKFTDADRARYNALLLQIERGKGERKLGWIVLLVLILAAIIFFK